VTATTSTRGTLLLLGGASLALTLAALALHVPGADTVGTDLRHNLFVALLGVAAAVYLLAVGLVVRRPAATGSVLVVLGVAIAMRLVVLIPQPFLSSDVYRYVWDGRVQVAGINPFRYMPADPALQSLRDDAIYPNINRADTARTIYPPAAQLVFQAVARISPTVVAMKLAMVAFEALACWAMLRVLALARLPGERVLIYAWNPGAVWAFAGNGHVDAIAIGLLAVAFLLRVQRRDTWVGVAFGAAVLVKFLPAAVAPALWRPPPWPPGWPWEWKHAAWRMPLVALATIVALYALYGSVGWHVLGYLPGYFGEEDLSQGPGIWLLGWIALVQPVTPLMAEIYAAIVLACLAALGAWIAFRPRPQLDTPQLDARRICADAAILAAALTVAISPHYPWYFVWLALPCCVFASWTIIWIAVAPVLLYINPFHDQFIWPSVVYLPAAALLAREWWQSAARRSLAGIKATQGSS